MAVDTLQVTNYHWQGGYNVGHEQIMNRLSVSSHYICSFDKLLTSKVWVTPIQLDNLMRHMRMSNDYGVQIENYGESSAFD